MVLSSHCAAPDAAALNKIGAPTKTGTGVQLTSGTGAAAAARGANETSSRRLRDIASGLSGLITGIDLLSYWPAAAQCGALLQFLDQRLRAIHFPQRFQDPLRCDVNRAC